MRTLGARSTRMVCWRSIWRITSSQTGGPETVHPYHFFEPTMRAMITGGVEVVKERRRGSEWADASATVAD